MYRVAQKSHAMILLGYIAATVALSGCGQNGRQALSGSVTLDGQPLASGSITFQPMAGSTGSTSGTSIQDGNFTIDKTNGLLPGKYAVSIQSSWKTGRMKNEGGVQIPELIPLRFHPETPLEAIISSDDGNEFEHKLTTSR